MAATHDASSACSAEEMGLDSAVASPLLGPVDSKGFSSMSPETENPVGATNNCISFTNRLIRSEFFSSHFLNCEYPKFASLNAESMSSIVCFNLAASTGSSPRWACTFSAFVNRLRAVSLSVPEGTCR